MPSAASVCRVARADRCWFRVNPGSSRRRRWEPMSLKQRRGRRRQQKHLRSYVRLRPAPMPLLPLHQNLRRKWDCGQRSPMHPVRVRPVGRLLPLLLRRRLSSLRQLPSRPSRHQSLIRTEKVAATPSTSCSSDPLHPSGLQRPDGTGLPVPPVSCWMAWCTAWRGSRFRSAARCTASTQAHFPTRIQH